MDHCINERRAFVTQIRDEPRAPFIPPGRTIRVELERASLEHDMSVIEVWIPTSGSCTTLATQFEELARCLRLEGSR